MNCPRKDHSNESCADGVQSRRPLQLKRKEKMKILITAPENDSHTAPLKWALEQAGYSVACWSGLGWTDITQASISLLPDCDQRYAAQTWPSSG